MKTLLPVIALLVACNKDSGPSCADRVARFEKHLASPRSLEAIMRDASPALRGDLEATMASDPAQRAVAIAERLEKAVTGCPELIRVFGEIAGLEPAAKDEHLRTGAPKAFLACKCAASPEHAGGLLESILSSWEPPR